MEQKEKRHSGNSILRAIFVGLSLLFQVGWILLRILELNEHYAWVPVCTAILALIVVLRLYSKHTTAAMKMPWIMLILTFPVMGLTLYLLIVICGDLGSTGKRLKGIQKQIREKLPQSEEIVAGLEEKGLTVANISRYLRQYAGSPVYGNTEVIYHGEAADAFEDLKESLEKAESFIFMEYFIVREGAAFQELQEILIRKAKQGVEVRLMYDDIGSIGYVNWAFAKRMNALGIQCRVFNPALPVLNLFMNHRNHRKITVIDGKVGFTGGYNLSDEYFGRAFPYGKWKDTGVRLEGEAVRSLTADFLEMWNVSDKNGEDAEKYLEASHSVHAKGFVQPYSDDPLGKERVAENVYLNLIGAAKKSLYFVTPYLIITDEMSSALGLAAKRGVDVRIITPGIPDKKTVYSVTRSYYAGLAAQGVRIFEWSPGFCHAKQCICDGEIVSMGTSNLDYRSLYLHFENNVLLYDCEAVQKMEEDFIEMLAQCEEVTEKYRTGRGKMLRTWQCLLRLFAPMM